MEKMLMLSILIYNNDKVTMINPERKIGVGNFEEGSSNITLAIRKKSITIYCDGAQTGTINF